MAIRINSITVKLFVVIAGAFSLSIASVLLTANHYLTAMIDKNQAAIYSEKLDTITGILQRKADRLQRTGMVSDYEDDFKQSALTMIQQAYSGPHGHQVAPSLFDADGRVLMKPDGSVLPDPDTLQGDSLTQILAVKHGTILITSPSGEQIWCMVRQFPTWNWVIAFIVPVDVKYADLTQFKTMLFCIMGGIAVIFLGFLLTAVARFVRPVTRLTAIARRMADGDLDQSIPVGGSDEVAVLANSFSNMRDSIRSTIRDLDANNDALHKEIAEHKKTERTLRLLEKFLKNIIDSMPSVLISVTTEGSITQWNREAARATGIPEEQAVGQPIDRIYPELAAEMKTLANAVRTRSIQQGKKQVVHDGETRVQDITIYPLIKNGVDGAVIRIDDVTDRIRIQEMMVQTEKMMSVGGLAAGMAHEINNPLGIMIQSAQNIVRRVSPDISANLEAARDLEISLADVRKYLEKRGILTFVQDIRDAGERAAKIVTDMLQFSRKSDSTLKPESLSELIDQTVSLAGNDYDLKKKYDFRQIRINREFDPDLPRVPVIRTEIEQVILNLLKNAAQAMALAETPMPEITLRTRQQNSWAVLEVQDNGPGIDDTIKNRVFEPFFTTKPVGSGTGLGLSVSFIIVEINHQGSMTVESSPGHGCRFILRLPLTPEPLTINPDQETRT